MKRRLLKRLVEEEWNVFWEEESPLGGAGREVHEVVSLKPAGGLRVASLPSFSSSCPREPVLPASPPWTGWHLQDSVYITAAPSLQGGDHPALPPLCAFGLGVSPPSTCLSLPLPSHAHGLAR